MSMGTDKRTDKRTANLAVILGFHEVIGILLGKKH